MCDCIEFDSNNGRNANLYSDKPLKPFNDNKVLHSLRAPTDQLTNGTKTWDKPMISVENETKSKGIVVAIDSGESPTIDAVLDKVPLIYDPITKQLLLQKNFVNNNGLNGYKNGLNLQNGIKKLNGFSNLNHEKKDNRSEDNRSEDTKEAKDKSLSSDQYSTPCYVNNISVDNGLDNKFIDLCQNNDYSGVECKQSSNDWFERRTESHSSDNNDLLSVFDSNKDHSLLEVNKDPNNLSADNGCEDNISNVDSSVSSLNLDDSESICGSVSDSKPKKLFTLSLQSLINKVKRNNNPNNNCVNISSTTALILETRPPTLPAKPEDEQKKHKSEYEEMLRQSKKREVKEMKAKKRLIEKQRKQEEQVIEAIKVWNSEVLPNWHKCRNSKKTRDLWWSGIPSVVRQKIWTQAITNELNITEDIYRQCVNRSKEKVWMKANCADDECCGESTADLIKLDVSRTFCELGLFQEFSPYHEVLTQLLGAYVSYAPDIGYAQGMSFLAAMLLLNTSSAAEAFICFANLLNNQLLVSFFSVDQTVMNAFYQTFEEFFRENLPKLYKHFEDQKCAPDFYLPIYISTLFSRSLPLDVASRVWDVIIRDGHQFILRTALGILSMYCEDLLNLDFIYLAQFLTKLPEDIDSNKLFSYISAIRMTIGSEKTPFSDVLSSKLNNK